MPGEVIIPVPPLAVRVGTDLAALGEFSAVRLFMDRALAVRPSFSITPANTASVIEIVTSAGSISASARACRGSRQTALGGADC